MSIAEIKIESIQDIEQIVLETQYDDKLMHYRSPALFRGLPNATYALQTSLYRNCKEKSVELETSILRNFYKYALSTENHDSCWERMVVGQHHGLPTRLMDWSYSPLIALHFATSGEDFTAMEAHDAVIWKIDIDELNELLPENYKELLAEEHAKLFTTEMLEKVAKNTNEYDEAMKSDSMVLLEPFSSDQRIINQYSYFSILPKEIVKLEDFLEKNTCNTVKYILDKSIRWHIRDMLDQCNINERTVYPGLDGIAMWLKRHYYVR